MENVIEVENLSKSFTAEKSTFAALCGVSFTVKRGEILGIVGFSGAGKSTLVRCLNGLEQPDGGSARMCGEEIRGLKGSRLLNVRRKIGTVFQNFNLLQQKTALKNVLFPLEVAGVPRKERTEKALQLLDEVGLKDKAKSYPSQLSGGQQQRVAIARALALNPEVLLCDEATSALDPETTAQILRLIKQVNEKYLIATVVISHQLNVIKSVCDRVIVLDGGKISEEGAVDEVFARPKSEAAKRLFAYEGINI